MSSSSSLSSWRTRAEVYPSGSSYNPLSTSLVLFSLRDTMAEQNTLNFALFTDRVVITALGDVLVLALGDYNTITELIKALPQTESVSDKMQWWRVKHLMSCRPMDRVGVLQDGSLKKVGVYGYSAKLKELSDSPVEGVTKLPDELSALMDVIMEGRTGYDGGTVRTGMLKKVHSILPQLN